MLGVEPAWARVDAAARHPFFSEIWYLETFPDAAEEVAAGAVASGFMHYKTKGYPNRSPHWLFSEMFYRMNHPDLTQSSLEGGSYWNGYDHFLRQGDQEGRQGSLFFDPRLYRKSLNAGLEAHESPFVHFALRDFKQDGNHRLSWYFDADWYLNAYPQARAELDEGAYGSALEHYLCSPNAKGLDPSRFFSEAFYLATNKDIAEAIQSGMLRNGYDHFIQYGVFERRQPNPATDLEDYFRNVHVQADVERGLFRDAYAHYVAAMETRAPRPAMPADEYQTAAAFDGLALNNAISYARRPMDFSCTGPAALCVVMVLNESMARNIEAVAALFGSSPRNETELLLINPGKRADAAMLAKFVHGARILDFGQFPAFLNAGFAVTVAPAILLLDDGVIVEAPAIQAALERLVSNDDIGAVCGKVVSSNGALQEAGRIIWQDGFVSPYLAGEDAGLPEANFIRSVDGAGFDFMMLKREAMARIVPLSQKSPMMAAAALCIRMQEAGYQIVYDPSVSVQKRSDYQQDTHPAMDAGQERHAFTAEFAEFLKGQHRRETGSLVKARHSPRDRRPRVLFIEDRIPFRKLGSGYTRSNDIIHALLALDYHVTLYPVFKAVEDRLQIYHEFPDRLEVVFDRELPDLNRFLQEREGYFDVLWVGRTQNAARILDMLKQQGGSLPKIRRILDTEAVASLRTRMKHQIADAPGNMGPLMDDIREEMKHAYHFNKIIAVNKFEEDLIRDAGFLHVQVLGHAQTVQPTEKDFAARRGLLFVGSIHDADSPNLDSLTWFVENVMPELTERLGPEFKLTVAGFLNRRVNLTRLAEARHVEIIGPVDDLTPLYDAHRIFIAPTRFAAGIPYKLHEAAAHGIPIVASSFLARQLEWTDGNELLTANPDDPAGFVEQIVRLYQDDGLWTSLRDKAIGTIKKHQSPEVYLDALRRIVL